MKMEKASKEELDKVNKWTSELEYLLKYQDSDEELLAHIRKAPRLFRVALGYRVLVDNCTDPKADTVELNERIKGTFQIQKQVEKIKKEKQNSEKFVLISEVDSERYGPCNACCELGLENTSVKHSVSKISLMNIEFRLCDSCRRNLTLKLLAYDMLHPNTEADS